MSQFLMSWKRTTGRRSISWIEILASSLAVYTVFLLLEGLCFDQWVGRLYSLDKTVHDWRGRSGGRPWKSWWAGMKIILGKRWVPLMILFISSMSYLHRMKEKPRFLSSQNVEHNLWSSAPSFGWRSSCAQRASDWLPPRKSNGYLVVRSSGGFGQQRIAICNAVVAARIMNATLVLPQVNDSFWHRESGVPGIYDVDHFITTLKNDIRVVRSLPTMWGQDEKRTRLKPFQLQPPRDASVQWYETTALEKLKEHGAVYLNPFGPHLEAELDNQEYQRLRCRVNYHALRFSHELRNLSSLIVERLHSEEPYLSIHLGFAMDDNGVSVGCLDTSNITEGEAGEKNVEASQTRLNGDCPSTPKAVGLFLRALGFDNSTRIYLSAGEMDIGGEALDPLQAIFPLLETRSTIALPEELAMVNAAGPTLHGLAVDYIVCLLSEIFIPTYYDPTEGASDLIGQRLYYGFRTTLHPDQKALASLFTDLESGVIQMPDFETLVRQSMSGKSSGGPHSRVSPESFYTNPWPECFCSNTLNNGANHCPLKTAPSILSYEEDQDDNLAGWNI